MCTDVFHCMINIDCMLCYSMYLPMHVAVTLLHVPVTITLPQLPMLSSVPSQLIKLPSCSVLGCVQLRAVAVINHSACMYVE